MMIPGWALALICALAAANLHAQEFDTLYDQSASAGITALESQDYLIDGDADGQTDASEGADDFVVPAGELWHLAQVMAQGEYQGGQARPDFFHVRVYADANGRPGAEVGVSLMSGYTDPLGNGSPLITLSPPAMLTPGRYWLSVQARLDFASGTRWGWTDSWAQSGAVAAWRSNFGGAANPCPSWMPRTECAAGSSGPDNTFLLVGRRDPFGSQVVCASVDHALAPTATGTSVKWASAEVVDDYPVGHDLNIYALADSKMVLRWNHAPPGNGASSRPTGDGYYNVLATGDLLGAFSTMTRTGNMRDFRDGVDGYLGFRFECPAGICYGYAHLRTTPPTGYPATLVDYCYEASGGAIRIDGGALFCDGFESGNGACPAD